MKVTVPTSLEGVTIAQHRRLEELAKIEDETTRLVRQVAFLCQLTEAQVRAMETSSFNKVLEAMRGLINPKADWPLVRFIEIEGERYGFHPNLSSLTVSEYADLETYCRDAHDNLEAILSILYRKVTEEHGVFYKITPYTGSQADKFGEVTMNVALGALAFFLRTAINLQADLNSSLKETAKAG